MGGKRIALRTRYGNGNPDVVNYLHGDHLGSTSLTTNASGAVVAQARYLPFGGTRWTSGALRTDYLFTGQKQEANIGLYDFNARFYDPLLGRFLSADSIVPGAGNPQAFNRYSYALNNPLKYTDPSGHCIMVLCRENSLGFALAWKGGRIAPSIASLTVAAYTAAEVGTVVAAANADKVPGAADQARQMAQDAGNAIQRASQGGNTADPGGMDPWRWGKNYRQNYEQYYDVSRDSNYQVNHILPQRFRQVMADVGINIDDPRWLREVQSNPALGNNHQQYYTNAWKDWARNLQGRTPTAAEVVQFAQQLEQDYIAKFGTAFYREGEGLPGLIDWAALWAQIQAATQANVWTAP